MQSNLTQPLCIHGLQLSRVSASRASGSVLIAKRAIGADPDARDAETLDLT